MKCPTYGFESFDDLGSCKRCGANIKSYQDDSRNSIPTQREIDSQTEDTNLTLYPQPDLSHIMKSIRESLEEIEGAKLAELSENELKPESSIQPELRSLKKRGGLD
jgi:hypothetical protein